MTVENLIQILNSAPEGAVVVLSNSEGDGFRLATHVDTSLHYKDGEVYSMDVDEGIPNGITCVLPQGNTPCVNISV